MSSCAIVHIKLFRMLKKVDINFQSSWKNALVCIYLWSKCLLDSKQANSSGDTRRIVDDVFKFTFTTATYAR